ncbi:MAG: APC family permease [Alphaproteobacteria bacterium]|nr:APC family permease [Alphaproteobacteria bacterium]
MTDGATSSTAQPRRHVSEAYIVMLAVAMVVGAGIFKSPSLVAENAGSTEWLFAAWLIGGLVSLIGALCYAELASAFPDAGGDYHFLKRAYGREVGFLFAWSRFAIINTGSIALLGFTFGDYMQEVVSFGAHGGAIWAILAVAALTILNLRGMKREGAGDFALTGLEVVGVLMMGVAAIWMVVNAMPPASASAAATGGPPDSFGYALVFALLAYGGWNEVATLSAEVRDPKRGIARALIVSVLVITALYMFAAWAFWRGLGIEVLAKSTAPAADLMAQAFGPHAGWLTAIAIACAAFTSINATIIVGGRTTYAAAHDWSALAKLGRWDGERAIPTAAYIAQGAVSMLLVLLGAFYDGFSTLVDYTAPVFWLFMAASGLAVIVLRFREKDAIRPFRTPLYPVLPLAFAGASIAMVWSSLAYVREGAWFGFGVVAAGGVVMAALNVMGKRTA